MIACSYDGLQFLESIGYPREKVLLDPRIYTWNNRSLHAFRRLGYRRFGAPCELNAGELMHRENGDSYLTVYGRAALMIDRQLSGKEHCRMPEKTGALPAA